MKLYCPGKPEQRNGDQHRSNVGERKSVFWFLDAAMLLGEHVENGVDARDQEPDCNKEPKAGSEIHKPNLECVEMVVSAVNRLELRIKAVSCGKDKCLVGSHCYYNRLGKENSKRALNGLSKFCSKGSIIFAIEIVVSTLILLEPAFSVGEQNGNEGFFEEDVAGNCHDPADYKIDPEQPAPFEIAENYAAEKWSQGWS